MACMSDLAVVPVMYLSHRLFLDPADRAQAAEDSTLALQACEHVVVPLVPSGAAQGSRQQRTRRWLLRSLECGSRWVPEDFATSKHPSEEESSHIPSYTDEEYSLHLATEGWSQEETAYLLELCRRFNLRFVIIADRYAFSSSVRAIEDLRERYYQVAGKLAAVRTGDMRQFVYEKEGDRRFRLTMESLHSRPREALQEEAVLAEMMSQMKICLPRVARARERLLITCGGLGQQLLSHAPTIPEILGLLNSSRSRKGALSDGQDRSARPRSRNHNPPSAASSSTAASNAAGTGTGSSRAAKKRRSTFSSGIADAESDLQDGSFGTFGGNRRVRSVLSNTFARSTHLNPIRIGLGRQVEKMLQEMGMRTAFIS